MRYAVSAKVVPVGLAVHPIGLTGLRTAPAGIRDRGPMYAGPASPLKTIQRCCPRTQAQASLFAETE
jgi:hypothetical protein